jgi:hypothetical protein
MVLRPFSIDNSFFILATSAFADVLVDLSPAIHRTPSIVNLVHIKVTTASGKIWDKQGLDSGNV